MALARIARSERSVPPAGGEKEGQITYARPCASFRPQGAFSESRTMANRGSASGGAFTPVRRCEMRSKLIACALLISVSSTALADPKDYKFHAVSATVKKDDDRYDSQ